jgi:hypothetical protein
MSKQLGCFLLRYDDIAQLNVKNLGELGSKSSMFN